MIVLRAFGVLPVAAPRQRGCNIPPHRILECDILLNHICEVRGIAEMSLCADNT